MMSYHRFTDSDSKRSRLVPFLVILIVLLLLILFIILLLIFVPWFQTLDETKVFESYILLFGGGPNSQSRQSIEVFNPGNQSRSKLRATKLQPSRYGPIAELVGGSVLLAGGGDHDSPYYNSTLFYDPLTDTQSPGPQMTTARQWAASTVFNGQVYTCGGETGKGDTSSCEKLAGNSWKRIASMKKKRRAFAMVSINGYILAIGGATPGVHTRTVEKYDVDSDAWSYVASMNRARGGLDAVVYNGEVYVCGDVHIKECEKYNPSNDQWTKIANLRKTRECFSLVEFRGELIALGGGMNAGRDVEIYNVTANTWTASQQHLIRSRWCSGTVVL